MQGPESTNKRRVNAYCLESMKMVGLVCTEEEKKQTENFWK